jgi:hypothetical protein
MIYELNLLVFKFSDIQTCVPMITVLYTFPSISLMQSENLPTGVPIAIKFMLGLCTQLIGFDEVLGVAVFFFQANKVVIKRKATVSFFILLFKRIIHYFKLYK